MFLGWILFFLLYAILMNSRTVHSYPVSKGHSHPVSSVIEFSDVEDYKDPHSGYHDFCIDIQKEMIPYVRIVDQPHKVITYLTQLFNEKYYNGVNFPSTYSPLKSVILTPDDLLKYNRHYCKIKSIPRSEWIWIYCLMTVFTGLLMVILFCWKL